jgi:hypothetical protein
MPTDHIVALLIAERDKLNSAIEALPGTKTPATPAAEAPAAEATTRKKRRQISAAARRNMAIGQRTRYAAIKAAKPAATPPVR